MPPTLVRPQTFNPLQSSDSASPAVRFQLTLLLVLAAWLFYLYKLFCTEPNISSFQGARTYCLVFAFQYTSIVQQLEPLPCKYSIPKNVNLLRPKGRGFRPMKIDETHPYSLKGMGIPARLFKNQLGIVEFYKS